MVTTAQLWVPKSFESRLTATKCFTQSAVQAWCLFIYIYACFDATCCFHSTHIFAGFTKRKAFTLTSLNVMTTPRHSKLLPDWPISTRWWPLQDTARLSHWPNNATWWPLQDTAKFLQWQTSVTWWPLQHTTRLSYWPTSVTWCSLCPVCLVQSHVSE